MKKYNPVKFIKDEIIGSENTFHAWCVLAAVSVIVGMGFYLNSPDLSFHGIAGSREANVNFEHPVEIKQVHVIQGQRVQKGDLLIELNQTELNTQIRQLTAKIEKLRAEKNVRDQMNKAVGNNVASAGTDPLSVELRELEEERSVLERQRNNLYVFAEIDGIVGSVNFKRGERAPSFASLVTISPDSPTFVQGFVNEQLRTNVRPGSHVKISSLTTAGSTVEGKVVSVGARFVEVPARISGVRGIPIWGREVMVEIPKSSNIILGEKVLISPITSLFPALVARADEDEEAEKAEAAPAHVKLPPALADKTSFEASGAVYLPDLKKYLIVSDDTNEANAPWVFLMSENGEVEERPLTLPDVKEMNDMESVSEADGYLYVMSSLSASKGKELKKNRSLFVRTKRNGALLGHSQQINLANVMRKLIKNSQHPLLQAMAQEGLAKFEVEAHAVRDGALYLGLKAPQTADNASLILRLPNVDDLFTGRDSNQELEVWKTVKFEENDGFTYRISDLTFVGNTAYFTTSCKNESCGAFWSLGENEAKPKLLRKFKTDSPEGVAYNPQKNTFLITFDLGSRGSKFTTINGPLSGH